MQELVFLTTLLTFIVGGTVSSKVIFFVFFFSVQTKIRSMLQIAGDSSFVPYEETF